MWEGRGKMIERITPAFFLLTPPPPPPPPHRSRVIVLLTSYFTKHKRKSYRKSRRLRTTGSSGNAPASGLHLIPSVTQVASYDGDNKEKVLVRLVVDSFAYFLG